MFGVAAVRTQSGSPFAGGGFVEEGRAPVSVILQHAPDCPAQPVGEPRLRSNSLLLQSSTDLGQGASVEPHPAEHFADDRGLLIVDFPACSTAPFRLADVAIPVGCFAEGADASSAGGVQLAPP